MEARAELRQVRISPRKVGVVLDLIRNKPCDMAMAILKHTPSLYRSSSSQQWQTQRTITQWIFPSAMFRAATLAPALL